MKSKNVLLFGFGLVVTLLVVSCQSETEPALATLSVEPITTTVVSQLSLESTTSSPLPTITSVINVEKTSDLIPDPTASITVALETATPLPTLATPTIVAAMLTPLPTLAGEELELAVAELLENPMDCGVPCWWGAIPGVATINEIRHALAPYNFDIYEYQYQDETEQITVLRVGIGHDEDLNDFNIRIGYGFSNSILIDVSAYSPAVSEILTNYGQPDEVWIETMGFEREGDLPVRLNLVYLQAGMAVGYVVDGDIQDDVVIGCFTDEEMGRLRLITPDTAMSHEDFPTIFEEDRRYLSLEEAADLSIDDFMQRFTDPTQPHCIATPAELWE